ncbi:hypothetical protein PHMEG_00014456 [Phytophthora megakarya]|uniref:Transmembrane protein n=1 Tax=Phytophthora megakarya TaxID=4795 RepID=A0A225W3R3_9STRA|nr:hypothetical protein PHMEG_00014456 [Phytophthora megakarya]
MVSQAPVPVNTRVTPLRISFSSNTVAPEHPVRDTVVSKSAITFVPQSEVKTFRHYSTQLRFHLQWRSAAKMQLLTFRNTVGCVIVAVLANGCFYSGNVFSLKSSTQQSHSEFLMAMMVWTSIVHTAKMMMAYLPSLTTQRFLEYPDNKPIFTTGIALVARKIYYNETNQGHERQRTLNDVSDARQAARAENSPSRMPHRPPNFRTTNFWGEYKVQFPKALFVITCGGFVHMLSWYGVLNRGRMVIVGFTALGIFSKLALQEAARHYIVKKRIRSIRTMCVLVGMPTVLIDTQSRIFLLGTQTNSFLIAGTCAMAIAEICLRVVKAAYVSASIRRRANDLEQKLFKLSTNSEKTRKGPTPASLKLEFELWERQVLSYHTAEVTADMYAEYISIGCSQSIIFWWAGHPLYPALQLDTGTHMSPNDTALWRLNQVGMLAFQFLIEIFVDYLCVVMEMAAGIDFERIESLSTFLGVLFMMLAALNINISSAIYLSWST